MSDNFFASSPAARKAVESATGLSGDDVDRVIDGLTDVGLAPTLSPNADSDARYSYALSFLRTQNYSIRGAARAAGLDCGNFRRRLIRTHRALIARML